jgi:hemerythrin superfamily protein
MIRLDHTHVLAAFRRYHGWLPDSRKEAVVANVCLGLEIHAQLEEEIFYPAVAKVDGTGQLENSVAEHDEMRVLMERLRQMTPRDGAYDETFYELVRTVLHHVADEETTLLPLAENRLKDELRELGWRMTMRRVELLKPHVGQIASTTVRTFPLLTGVLAAGLLALTWLVVRPSATNGR